MSVADGVLVGHCRSNTSLNHSGPGSLLVALSRSAHATDWKKTANPRPWVVARREGRHSSPSVSLTFVGSAPLASEDNAHLCGFHPRTHTSTHSVVTAHSLVLITAMVWEP